MTKLPMNDYTCHHFNSNGFIYVLMIEKIFSSFNKNLYERIS